MHVACGIIQYVELLEREGQTRVVLLLSCWKERADMWHYYGLSI
jgi:hypothetical protein